MHQMRISTTYVSSVMLRPKNLEIQNIMTVKTRKKSPTRMPWNGAKSVEWCWTLFIDRIIDDNDLEHHSFTNRDMIYDTIPMDII
jgi:hypothetical protein